MSGERQPLLPAMPNAAAPATVATPLVVTAAVNVLPQRAPADLGCSNETVAEKPPPKVAV